MVSNGCLELSDSMSDVVGYFNDAIASLRKLKTKESSAMVSVLEPLIRSLATVPNAIAREADEADDIAKEYLADEDDSEMDGSQAGMY